MGRGQPRKRDHRKKQKDANTVAKRLAGLAATISAPVLLFIQVLRLVLELTNRPPMG